MTANFLLGFPAGGVKSRITDLPAITPVDGDYYIVPVGATLEWADKDLQLAHYVTDHWEYTVPANGDAVRVMDEDFTMDVDLDRDGLIGASETFTGFHLYCARGETAGWYRIQEMQVVEGFMGGPYQVKSEYFMTKGILKNLHVRICLDTQIIDATDPDHVFLQTTKAGMTTDTDDDGNTVVTRLPFMSTKGVLARGGLHVKTNVPAQYTEPDMTVYGDRIYFPCTTKHPMCAFLTTKGILKNFHIKSCIPVQDLAGIAEKVLVPTWDSF